MRETFGKGFTLILVREALILVFFRVLLPCSEVSAVEASKSCRFEPTTEKQTHKRSTLGAWCKTHVLCCGTILSNLFILLLN